MTFSSQKRETLLVWHPCRRNVALSLMLWWPTSKHKQELLHENLLSFPVGRPDLLVLPRVAHRSNDSLSEGLFFRKLQALVEKETHMENTSWSRNARHLKQGSSDLWLLLVLTSHGKLHNEQNMGEKGAIGWQKGKSYQNNICQYRPWSS